MIISLPKNKNGALSYINEMDIVFESMLVYDWMLVFECECVFDCLFDCLSGSDSERIDLY